MPGGSFISNQDLENATKSFDENKEKNLFVNNNINHSNERRGESEKTGTEKSLRKSGKSHQSSESSEAIIIQEVSYRWFIAVFFFLLSFSNGFQWVTFSAIAEDIKYYLDMDSTIVNLFSLSYMYLFPVVFPLAAYVIDNVNVKLGVC